MEKEKVIVCRLVYYSNIIILRKGFSHYYITIFSDGNKIILLQSAGEISN